MNSKNRTLRQILLAGAVSSSIVGCATTKTIHLDAHTFILKESGVTCYAIQTSDTASVREEEPDTSFNIGPEYVGSSAEGFERFYVNFSYLDIKEIPEKATVSLVLSPLSGSCLSSYNADICGLPMTLEVYRAGQYLDPTPAVHDDPWNMPKHDPMTWNNQPGYNESGKVDSVTIAISKSNGLKVYDLPNDAIHGMIELNGDLYPRYSFVSDNALTASLNPEERVYFSVEKYVRAVQRDGYNTGLMIKVENDTPEFRDYMRTLYTVQDNSNYRQKLKIGRESQRDIAFASHSAVIAENNVIQEHPYLEVCP